MEYRKNAYIQHAQRKNDNTYNNFDQLKQAYLVNDF